MPLHILAEKIAFFLLKKQVIEQSKFEICFYGLEILIASIVNGVLVFVAAILLNEFWETLFLLIPFMLIRKNAGGYHAKTHIGCSMRFLIVYVVSILTVKALPYYIITEATITVIIVSIAIILPIGAIKHENRPISELEFSYFKKKARQLTVILSTIGFAGIYLNPRWFLFYSLGLFIAAGSLQAAWINKKIERG